jgi:TonB family protein
MNTVAVRGDWAGRVIDGRFILLQWLGGSEGSGVFLTELQGDGTQKAAIKLIAVDAAVSEAQVARWAVTTTLSHPHLMRLFHTGHCQIEDESLVYSVTEYADEALSQILPERPLTPTEAREMLDPVLDALSYLHGKGFVHGHLKPSNIMVVDNQLKLSGDGIHVPGERDRHFQTLGVYDAPECATVTITAAADMWSLGVTLVEALTQHPPVWDKSTNDLVSLPESMPQPFADIAQGCLQQDPAHRWTLKDVKAHLEPVQSLPVPASRIDTTAPISRRLALVLAVIFLVAVIAVLRLRSHHTQQSLPLASQRPETANAAPPAQSPASETQSAKGAVVKGEVAERVLPDVLPSARESIRGTVSVRIRVTVDPSGIVSNATFDTPGPSKYFAKVSLQAAQHWKFKPAHVDGQAASSVWVLEFQFRQSATEVTPVEATP